MALMSDIVKDVLVELRFGAGQDVQIHLQEGIAANVSRLYRTLMMKHVWRDYHTITELVIDATTGQSTTSLATIVSRFSNVIAVYLENESTPLPVAPVMSNPALLKRPVLVANGAATVFTIWPKLARNVIMITRNFDDGANFEMADEVPFYRDVLALGAAYMLSVKVGTNEALTVSLKNQFDSLLDLHVVREMQDTYQLNTQHGTFPTEWFVTQ